jgi:PAS domain S-box-containing protein
MNRPKNNQNQARQDSEKDLADPSGSFSSRETFFRQALDTAFDAIIALDSSGKVLFWNQRAEKLFGWDSNEILGNELVKFIIPEEHRQAHVQGIANYVATGHGSVINQLVELSALNKEGEEVSIELSISPTEWNGNTAFIGIVRDISERKQHEATLDRSMRLALENPNPILRVGDRGKISFANPPATQVLSRWKVSVGGDLPEQLKTSFEQALTTKNKQEFEIEINRRPFLFDFVPVENCNDVIIYGRDTMASRKRIKTLEGERQSFLDILDSLPVAFHLQAPDYSIPFANKMFRERFGNPEERPCYTVMHKRASPCEVCTTFKVFDSKKNEVSLWTALDGRSYMTVCTPFVDIDGRHLVMEMGIDITEQKKAEKAMEIAKKEAERANNAKSEFLSRMSHELRTPMNAILGFSQLMQMNSERRRPGDQEHLGEIVKAGRHLLELINEVLDIARIESGQIQVTIAPIDVVDVIKSTITFLEPMAQKFSINMIEDFSSKDVCWIEGDKTRLKQIVINLVSNAIKYNSEKGTATIGCRQEDKNIQIYVADTGNGISEEDQKFIFEPFNRLKADHTQVEGTGIGLTIAKQLTEHMGGSLSLSSEVARGSCFTLAFPACLPPAGEHNETTNSIPSVKSEKIHLVHVGNNPGDIELIQQIFLNRQEIQLNSFYTFQEALDFISQYSFNLLILELDGMDEKELEQWQGFLDKKMNQEIPVIALAYQSRSLMESELRNGITAYIEKPIKINEFQQQVELLISQGVGNNKGTH